jgi:hypothetical protein
LSSNSQNQEEFKKFVSDLSKKDISTLTKTDISTVTKTDISTVTKTDISNKKQYNIQVIPVIFNKKNIYGDFNFMISQPEYNDSLFLFNDNSEDFIKKSCNIGGGNAIIRPYQCKIPQLATGIPTGSLKHGGYQDLEDDAKLLIDKSFVQIRDLLRTGNYKRVFYSADKNGKLGTSIFSVGKKVNEYIYQKLIDLPNSL